LVLVVVAVLALAGATAATLARVLEDDGPAAQRLWIDGVREQVLTINGCVNAKGQKRCGEDAEDDATDEATSTCD